MQSFQLKRERKIEFSKMKGEIHNKVVFFCLFFNTRRSKIGKLRIKCKLDVKRPFLPNWLTLKYVLVVFVCRFSCPLSRSQLEEKLFKEQLQFTGERWHGSSMRACFFAYKVARRADCGRITERCLFCRLKHSSHNCKASTLFIVILGFSNARGAQYIQLQLIRVCGS